MDEAMLWLRRIASIILFPIALVATVLLVLLVGAYFYLRAAVLGLSTLAAWPFRWTLSRRVPALPRPHFSERVSLPAARGR